MILCERQSEKDALDRSYNEAMAACLQRKCSGEIAAFEAAVHASHAILSCGASKLVPLAIGSTQLFATFYDLEHLRLRRPSQAAKIDWSIERPIAETYLLETAEHKEKLHYGVVSLLDDSGVAYYGEYTIALKETMIAHRTSAFIENSGRYFYRTHRKAPPGLRSTWADRHKLCVAKLASKFEPGDLPASFQARLLFSDNDSDSESFVEVQIFGEMTCNTFAKITLRKSLIPKHKKATRSYQAVISEYAKNAGVKFEVLP